MASDHGIFIRVPSDEKNFLDQYCLKTSRTKTDVLRGLLRALMEKESINA